jgi:hypothetical protein|tara:strand:+ start:28 stop:903 length:876 start_codon:yes stop_codon:yes gene_type:complete
MSEVAIKQNVEVKVDSPAHNRNIARAKKDEEELQELRDAAKGVEDVQESVAEVAEDVDDKNLSQEEKTFKQRYGDLRRHSAAKDQELNDKVTKLETQLKLAADNKLVLPKSDQDIEAWSKQHPDVASIVEAIADRKAVERSTDLDARLKEIEDLRADAKRDKAEAELIGYHPDFEGIRSSDEFHNWADEQPKWVKDALYENQDDARSVSRVIDLYKQDNNIKKSSTSSADRDAASSVKARTRNTPESDESKKYLSESIVNKMSAREYERRSEEIHDAMRNSKFIYDMSKST